MRRSSLFSVCGVSVLGLVAFFCMAEAASGPTRSTFGRVAGGATTARMPSMPTLPGMSVGNTSQQTPGGVYVPDDEPDVPDIPDVPDEPDNPDEPDTPVEPECPDGGVANSEYTVEDCMDDIQFCINTGGLPGGLNDLFNEGLFNSIKQGVGICVTQVEKCVAEVRKDCKNVYGSVADVWDDFNARRIQPEYYRFVLRKTGLTPYQAEYTCRLLDKNTYGSSFAAVANSGDVTAEYNKNVGAYNKQQNGKLDKNMPLGPDLNDGNPGVDGVRGHYARWDAPSATCLVRVAAYNKDKQITNSWLFGAAGDDRSAEVWRAAGDTFTCNKDLFGFSLMNDTKTAALVGVGGGTLLGAGVGAAVGKEVSRASYVPVILGCLYDDNINECFESLQLRDSRFYVCVNNSSLTTIEACADAFYNTYDFDDTQVFIGCGDAGNADWSRCLQSLMGQNDVWRICNVPDVTTATECERLVKSTVRPKTETQRGNRGATAAIGAATGAATGGLATAITAFVEKNNISCRVGDGLESVGYGKSYSIETLRDFYVRWNLQLPEKL